MNRTLSYQITAEDNNKTVATFLKEQGFSRHILIDLKKTKNSILRDGIWLYFHDILHTGDTILVSLTENTGSDGILPVDLPLTILYEDEDILVVNKPSGMPTHPSMDNYDNTLANAVLMYYQKQGIPFTFRCLNRLDRDTTGLTVIAKNALSSALLSSAIRIRQIHRSYLAIVSGITPESGTIDAPIARKDSSVIEREVNFSSGERAVTHFRRLAERNGLSLVLLTLETGRTHQIRVHMKYIGHPLIGDFLYHPDFRQINRQALHAARLSFLHPIKKEPLVFTAPLPPDMQALFPDVKFPTD